MNEAERFQVDGLTVRILYDEDPINPRKDYEPFGHMVCFHRRYSLGDEHGMSVEEAQELSKKILKEGGIVLPLFLYDHSGITMRTSAYSCPWDSGQVGFTYVSKKDIRENWCIKNVTKKKLEEACKLLILEVEMYDSYLTGECYGYIVESPEGEDLDSCWGYLGDIKYVTEEATSAAKSAAKAYFAEQRAKEMEYGAEHNA